MRIDITQADLKPSGYYFMLLIQLWFSVLFAFELISYSSNRFPLKIFRFGNVMLFSIAGVICILTMIVGLINAANDRETYIEPILRAVYFISAISIGAMFPSFSMMVSVVLSSGQYHNDALNLGVLVLFSAMCVFIISSVLSLIYSYQNPLPAMNLNQIPERETKTLGTLSGMSKAAQAAGFWAFHIALIQPNGLHGINVTVQILLSIAIFAPLPVIAKMAVDGHFSSFSRYFLVF